MSFCAIAAGVATVFAANAFTLSWEHSVEKTRWEEDWRVTTAGLELVEARVKGSGAGMDPPEGSRLVDDWWVYEPELPPRDSLALAASGNTRGGWSLCTPDRCVILGRESGGPIIIEPCRD